MKIPALLSSLLLLVSLPLAAQRANLSVTIDAPQTTLPGDTYSFSGTIVNQGPDPVSDARISMGMAGSPGCYEDFAIGHLDAGLRRTFTCSATVPPQAYRLGVWFSASSDFDPDMANNNAFSEVRVLSNADLRAWGSFDRPAVPGLPARIQVFYTNVANAASTDTVLRLATAGTFSQVPGFCLAQGGVATCRVGTVEPQQNPTMPQQFAVDIIAPDQSGARFDVGIEITAAEPDAWPADNVFTLGAFTYRTAFVTNTADSGPGSLRAAIDQTNAECLDTWPCMIAFRIPPAEGVRWHTIRPASPFQWITAQSIEVDGTTQTLYFGDANPEGPEIEISGTAATDGSGLGLVGGCSVAIRGLAINGFHTAGLLLGTGNCSQPDYGVRLVEKNYVGTDPTGRLAIPNGLGVYIDGGWRVERSTLSGNRRSGVWAQRGVNIIKDNVIGLSADRTMALGNQASGIYVGKAASGTDVSTNAIAFNHHFGVAIDPEATNVSVLSNEIHANWQDGIDIGLDGQPTDVPVARPEITRVSVDEMGTLIEGRVSTGTFAQVQVFANTNCDPGGSGEGEVYLGQTYEIGIDGTWSFRSPVYLDEKWITATVTKHVYNGWLTDGGPRSEGDTGWGYTTTTSEFSRCVQVP